MRSWKVGMLGLACGTLFALQPVTKALAAERDDHAAHVRTAAQVTLGPSSAPVRFADLNPRVRYSFQTVNHQGHHHGGYYRGSYGGGYYSGYYPGYQPYYAAYRPYYTPYYNWYRPYWAPYYTGYYSRPHTYSYPYYGGGYGGYASHGGCYYY